MKSNLKKIIYYFVDETSGELNKRGVILAGVLFVIGLCIIGYLEAGGLFPWE